MEGIPEGRGGDLRRLAPLGHHVKEAAAIADILGEVGECYQGELWAAVARCVPLDLFHLLLDRMEADGVLLRGGGGLLVWTGPVFS
jgi:hypothetical protein